MARTFRQLVPARLLPDGGHISRNPGALIELLLDAPSLRQRFAALTSLHRAAL